ncbi:MAG TPA: hypothetical protein VFC53_10730 [Dehalococcoidia bacterium]|nr:hypothetical protein [Dehalococcoidia bacterium]
MTQATVHDRTYLRFRLEEETGRARRYGHPFGLLVFEAVPATDALPIRMKVKQALAAIQATVRGSDVIAQVYEDMLVVLLVETEPQGVHDALFRIRSRITRAAGKWQVTLLTFPDHAAQIAALPFAQAA